MLPLRAMIRSFNSFNILNFALTILLLVTHWGCSKPAGPEVSQRLCHLIASRAVLPRWSWTRNPSDWIERLQAGNREYSVCFADTRRNTIAVRPDAPITLPWTASGQGYLEFMAAGITTETQSECESIWIHLDVISGEHSIRSSVRMEPAVSDSTPWTRFRVPLSHLRGETRCSFTVSCNEDGGGNQNILAFVGSPVFVPENPVPMPNILLICYDSLRADELGSYGSPNALSPVIDRLAVTGLTCSNTVSSSSWTIPSMKNILSGQYTYLDQAEVDEMTSSSGHQGQLIQETLAEAGYYTIAIVANPVIKARNDFNRGFDCFDISGVQFWRENSNEQIHLALRQAIAEHSGRPVFIYVHVMDPHDPYMPDKNYRLMHGPTGDQGIRPEIRRKESGILNLKPFSTDLLPLTQAETDYLRGLYRSEIRQADALLLRLMEEMRGGPGKDRECVLMVTADHGEEFGEHGFYQHGMSLYESSIKVPWITMDRHRIRRARIVPHRVSTIDIPATLCAMLGIRGDPSWEGLSVWTSQPFAPMERTIFSAVRSVDELTIPRMRWRALYAGDNKLVWTGPGRIIGYDLQSRPDEMSLFQVDRFSGIGERAPGDQWRVMGDTLELFNRQIVEQSRGKVSQLLTEQLKELGYVQ